MSSKAISPTANILRSSRLFSLPTPIPKPTPELVLGPTHTSDTATLPYPIQPSITTPDYALAQGDWGLKRPLPLRSTTRTSTPVIRVIAIDGSSHTTDFCSSADHVLTLRKWQELNLSISAVEARQPTASSSSYGVTGSLKSVFESELDRTVVGPQEAARGGGRWKFRGPWLAGQAEGEFQRYLDRQIRHRKDEFREYVRGHVKAQNATERRRIATDEGQTDGGGEESTTEFEVSEEELDAYIKSLRNNHETLSTLLHSFLDLPIAPRVSTYGASGNPAALSLASAELPPPRMHPSAGLSYLRTNAILPNHPILGPQAKSAPVQARVLAPQNSATGARGTAKVGVAGVVSEDTNQLSLDINTEVPGLSTWDTTTYGGGKIWVHPKEATIDAQGRIKLYLERSRDEVVSIHKGKLKGESAAPASGSKSTNETRTEADVLRALSSSPPKTYGLEDRDERRQEPSQPTTTKNGFARKLGYQPLEDMLRFDLGR